MKAAKVAGTACIQNPAHACIDPQTTTDQYIID